MDGLLSDISSTMMVQSNEEIQNISSQNTSVDPIKSVAQPNNQLKLQKYGNTVVNQNPSFGIGSWCWETAYRYSQILADICLNSGTTEVMKVALLGKWQDADVT
uniref:Uncharacterized protein n=1 Tax=Ciona savignyi TaxID=51511 RepID=H2ZA44_CIOSA